MSTFNERPNYLYLFEILRKYLLFTIHFFSFYPIITFVCTNKVSQSFQEMDILPVRINKLLHVDRREFIFFIRKEVNIRKLLLYEDK